MWERRTKETESGLWPTPISQDAKHSGYAASGPGKAIKLSYAVVQWPTPCASEARQGYQDRSMGKKGTQESLTTVVQGGPATQVGGSLNPTWVEWLMGWPLEWTALKPSETAKSPNAPPPPLSKAAGG